MKGLVVVICAPSQGGKDFVAKQIMSSLESVDNINTSYATSYKFREQREDDADHIFCVQSEADITVPEKDRITVTIYDTQKLFYDKKEIAEKISNDEVVFIATASPELAEKVKEEFGLYAITVFVKRQQVHPNIMLVEDLNRHGKKIPRAYSKKYNPEPLIIKNDFATQEEMEKSQIHLIDESLIHLIIENGFATQKEVKESLDRIKKRIFWYVKMKPEFERFVADRNLGADYIFKNWYTLIGGEWNSTIDEMAKREFISLCTFIMSVKKENECEGVSWRDDPNFDWFDEEIRTKNIFSMQDELLKHIEAKKEREF